MKKRISPLALGVFVIPYVVGWIVNALPRLFLGELAGFTKFFQYQYHAFALLFFVALVWAASASPTEDNPSGARLPRFWGMGFAALLLLTLGLVAYINPHSRLDNNNFVHINAGARVLKKQALLRLSERPNIVILGSSRAFTLSPDYIKEQTQLSVFNMSVDGGRVGDFAIQLDYMLAHEVKPDILLLDVAIETMPREVWSVDDQPLSLTPYMPAEIGLAVSEAVLRDLLGVYSLSDTLFLLTLPEAYDEDWTWAWTFQSDGLGVRKEVSAEKYQQLLRESILSRLNHHLYCRRFNKTATTLLEATIQRAGENGIAVLLYGSPLSAAFFDVARSKDEAGLETCSKFTVDYFMSLTEKYPHVFYKDLSEYPPISDLQENGFYDGVHLRPNAAQMVVDELLTEIELAYQWAQESAGK